jgi:TonB family protein
VTSSWDEAPLPGVSVVVKGSKQGTTTDAEGNFKLLAPQESNLVISYIGFSTEEVAVKSQESLKISLKEDVSSLSEVVVSGYSEKKATDENAMLKPQPEGGYADFRNYLRKNLRYPQEAKEKKVEGTVRVEFMVDAEGKLSDFKIKKGLGYGCDQEAIRLIQEGPSWQPATFNNAPVERKFNVFVPFKLK